MIFSKRVNSAWEKLMPRYKSGSREWPASLNLEFWRRFLPVADHPEPMHLNILD